MRHLITTAVLAAALAALVAPIAQADPARHMHDYLAARSSAIPHDIRDHAQIKDLIAGYPNASATAVSPTHSSFSWSDAGLGAGASAAALLLFGATAAVALRRRRNLAL
jgi:hypothetical protein